MALLLVLGAETSAAGWSSRVAGNAGAARTEGSGWGGFGLGALDVSAATRHHVGASGFVAVEVLYNLEAHGGGSGAVVVACLLMAGWLVLGISLFYSKSSISWHKSPDDGNKPLRSEIFGNAYRDLDGSGEMRVF